MRESELRKTRRSFLALTLPLAAATVFASERLSAQMAPQPEAPPVPGDPSIRRSEGPPSAPRFDPKAILKDNQDHIKKDVARLSGLVADLQKGLDGSDTTAVLSLDVVHKLDEIEKLARQIRGLVRG